MTKNPPTITDEQLETLFARHCECRPLELSRAANEHSHDCDTKILRDIQVVLGIHFADHFADRGVSAQAREQARDRCAVMFHAKRNALGGWDV